MVVAIDVTSPLCHLTNLFTFWCIYIKYASFVIVWHEKPANQAQISK